MTEAEVLLKRIYKAFDDGELEDWFIYNFEDIRRVVREAEARGPDRTSELKALLRRSEKRIRRLWEDAPPTPKTEDARTAVLLKHIAEELRPQQAQPDPGAHIRSMGTMEDKS